MSTTYLALKGCQREYIKPLSSLGSFLKPYQKANAQKIITLKKYLDNALTP